MRKNTAPKPVSHTDDHGNGREREIVLKFNKTMDEHYSKIERGPVRQIYRLREYAQALDLHPNYLNHIIKLNTGKTIGYWIKERNIATAKKMLKNPDMAVKEIAGRLQFTDASHVSNYFRKHTSLSPVMYRTSIDVIKKLK